MTLTPDPTVAARLLRDDELTAMRETFAEAMHTGYRHGPDCREAMQIHALIRDMPDDQWSLYVSWVAQYTVEPLLDHIAAQQAALEAAERRAELTVEALQRIELMGRHTSKQPMANLMRGVAVNALRLHAAQPEPDR